MTNRIAIQTCRCISATRAIDGARLTIDLIYFVESKCAAAIDISMIGTATKNTFGRDQLIGTGTLGTNSW